jgi:hypothetical protein
MRIYGDSRRAWKKRQTTNELLALEQLNKLNKVTKGYTYKFW